jgi:hypothetical protein
MSTGAHLLLASLFDENIHTCTHENGGGIDMDLATDLNMNFTWTPPLVSISRIDDTLEGPESITEDKVAAAFDEIKQRIRESPTSVIHDLMGKRFWWARYMILWSWNRLTRELPLQYSRTIFSRWDLTQMMVHLGMFSHY